MKSPRWISSTFFRRPITSKFSCGYGAWNEAPGRCHRDCFCLWHRDWFLAGSRKSSLVTRSRFRRNSRSAITVRASSVPAKWIKRASFTFLLAAALAIATFLFALHQERDFFELNVLDVGQDDSLFLVFPRRHTILVDGGGSVSDPAHRGETHGPDPGEEAVSTY
jgi:hypothetical protein